MGVSYSAAQLSAGGTVQLVAQIRLRIGDTVVGHGPRAGTPSNFDDAELLALASDSTVAGGVANAFDVLAGEYARLADMQAGPLRQSYAQIAARYAERAKTARAEGVASGELLSYGTFSTGLRRADGYSVRESGGDAL